MSERERVRDLLGPRRPDRLAQQREPLRDIEKTSPSPVEAPPSRPKMKAVVVAPVVAMVAPPPPPNLDAELRVLGAKPVIERKQKASKSMTAKEVLRQKTKALTDARPAGPKTLRSGEIPAASEQDDDEAAPESGLAVVARAHAPKNDNKKSNKKSKKFTGKVKPAKASTRTEEDADAEDEPETQPKPSFWARVKGFFSGR